jgi:hypothetical protein
VALLWALGCSACGQDHYDRARYCGAVAVTIGGAVDDSGRPLQEFDEADRRRSYQRLAELAPPGVRQDWRRIADLFGGNADHPLALPTTMESEARVKEHVKRECGIEIDAF